MRNRKTYPTIPRTLWFIIAAAVALLLLISPAQPVAASCGGATIVSTEAELDSAISNFNATSTGPCIFTILLGADINLTASTRTINNTRPNISLVIEGNGKTVNGQGTAGSRPFTLNGGTVTINQITITGGNVTLAAGSGTTGGGITNQGGSLTVTNSTITGNQSEGGGGGISNCEFCTLTVQNSTISGNTAGTVGGGIRASGTTTIDSSTLVNNVAGDGSNLWVSLGATATVRNSILANSVSGNDCGRETLGEGGTLIDGGHNLVETPGNCAASLTGPGTILNQDPALGPLANNGGPTQTHLPQAGSPAINAGDTTLTTDQRGVARPFGAADDIGAVEVEATCPAFPVSVANEGELNDAIGCFNSITTTGVYTINVTQDIPLTASTLAINNVRAGVSLVIEGAGHTVDGQGTPGVRPIKMSQGSVTINQITITGGNASGTENAGGGIYVSSGDLTVTNSTISGNTAGSGGGIDVCQGCSLIVRNSTISGNTAGSGGGGIASAGDPTIIDSSTLVDNDAQFVGGALLVLRDGNVTVSNSILANSPGTSLGDCWTESGSSLIDGGHNLVESPGNCAASFTGTGTILNQDPRLGPLANNGGPSQTHALLTMSPAIDAGATTLTTDQRGITRPQVAADDIGAYEAALTCPSFPASVGNESELNTAIVCYNAKTASGAYTIQLTGNIALTASTTPINNTTAGVSLVIEGAGHTVEGGNVKDVQVFRIAGGQVTIKAIEITRGWAFGTSGPTTGGGIYQTGGELTVTNSTFTGNDASYRGGAIWSCATCALTVENSTFDRNTGNSNGGAIAAGGTAIIDSSTLAANVSGLAGDSIYVMAGGTVTMTNSILADGRGLHDCDIETGGTLSDGGHNLVQYPSTCAASLTGTGTILNQNAQLNLLGDNGGPTRTMLPQSASPAIDAGATALATDQRGLTRPQGAADDIGAVEVAATCPAFPVAVANEGQLNYAIACFNGQTTPGTYTITITQDIDLTIAIATIDNPTSGVSLVIEGGDHIIDGGDDPANGVLGQLGFQINSPTPVTVYDLTVSGCRALLTGAAFKNSGGGPLLLDNVALLRNGSGFGGGALAALGPVTVTNSTIANNYSAAGNGGGIIVDPGGSLTVMDSEISDNNAALNGGAIIIAAGSSGVTISNSTIANNTADSNGGGISNGGILTITNSTIANNTAEVEGGGLFNDGELTIENSTIANNTSNGASAGGITSANGSKLTARNSTISGNSAGQTGGGLVLGTAVVVLDSVAIANNTATGIVAGGIYLKDAATITMTNSIVADNVAPNWADCGSFGGGGGTVWIESYNLVEDPGICTFTNGTNNTIVGQDPKLGPLADNGGATQTHTLLPGSPAIDVGDTTLTVDQRGITRPQGVADDIGAVEVCAPPAAPAVGIAISGTQVQLSWTGTVDVFDVFRSSNQPYFTPTASPYAAGVSSPWLDPDTSSIGDVANNYFYVVRTTNACGESADSNRVGEFDYTLVPGTP